jgi:hypothetical protein
MRPNKAASIPIKVKNAAARPAATSGICLQAWRTLKPNRTGTSAFTSKEEGRHTDEFVDPEADFVEKSRRLIIIVCLGGSLGFLLDRLLDVKSLGSEFLGLSGIVSNKDIVDYTLGFT